MKYRLLKIIAIFAIITTAFAGAMLDYFHASSEGENVRLEWKTGEETNLESFVIERKTPQSEFTELATVQPKGDNSFYSFIDEAAYKPMDVVFIYRLKIVDKDGQYSYSNSVTVSHAISGVKRTWGSIKAMFR